MARAALDEGNRRIAGEGFTKASELWQECLTFLERLREHGVEDESLISVLFFDWRCRVEAASLKEESLGHDRGSVDLLNAHHLHFGGPHEHIMPEDGEQVIMDHEKASDWSYFFSRYEFEMEHLKQFLGPNSLSSKASSADVSDGSFGSRPKAES